MGRDVGMGRDAGMRDAGMRDAGMVVSRRPATARRLSRQARRDQLVSAAIPLVARHGPMDLSLDDVAERVGVTRNLIYHYFPGGRTDLITAVAEEAERQLLGASVFEPRGAGPPDLDEAVSRMLDHALAPTHAWRIHRLARAAATPAVTSVIDRSTHEVVRMLLGARAPGEDASALTELALYGYVAYAEAVLDGARVAGIPRSDVRRLLAQTLRAIVAAE